MSADQPARNTGKAKQSAGKKPGGHGDRTRNWFAQGEEAEAALETLTRSAPLPAVYQNVEEERPSSWPRIALIAVVVCALIGAAIVVVLNFA